MIVPDQHVYGTMTWTATRTGEVSATVGYEANLVNPNTAWLRLPYTQGPHGGQKTNYNYRITLMITRPHYGGIRWWMRCPLSGRRTRVLHSPAQGGSLFASRQVWTLTYRSQRMSPKDRAIERSLKARKKLNIQDQDMLEMLYCPKPKWMRWRTDERLVSVMRECHQVWTVHMI